ncbi:MAG: nuclear transport factor 2 family protein [Pseudomonadota bacterium]
MKFSQPQLDDLAARYTAAWNSKVAKDVAAFHTASSGITINRGEPSLGHEGLTAMVAGFHSDVPDLNLQNDGIRSAGNHVIFMWTFTGHHSETGNPLNVSGWEEWELDDDMKVTYSLGWFDGDDYQQQVDGVNR